MTTLPQFKQTLIQATVASLCMCKTDDQREYTNTLTLMMEMYDAFLKTLPAPETTPTVVKNPKFTAEPCYSYNPDKHYEGHRIHFQLGIQLWAITEPMRESQAKAKAARMNKELDYSHLQEIVDEFKFEPQIKVTSKFELLKNAMGMIATHNVPFVDLERGGRSNTAQAYAEHILKSLDRLHDLDDTAMAKIKKLLEVKPDTPNEEVVLSVIRMVNSFDPGFKVRVREMLGALDKLPDEEVLAELQRVLDLPSQMLDLADAWALLGGDTDAPLSRDKVLDSIKSLTTQVDEGREFLSRMSKLFDTEGDPTFYAMAHTIKDHVEATRKTEIPRFKLIGVLGRDFMPSFEVVDESEVVEKIIKQVNELKARPSFDTELVRWLADVCNSLESTVGQRDAAHLLMNKLQKGKPA